MERRGYGEEYIIRYKMMTRSVKIVTVFRWLIIFEITWLASCNVAKTCFVYLDQDARQQIVLVRNGFTGWVL